jgi:hypothetical protein
MGYNGQTLGGNIMGLIDDCIEETKTLIVDRYVYTYCKIVRNNEKLVLKECSLELTGDNIRRHLKDCNSCIFLAVTLGSAVDMRIRYYEKSNMTKAVILDSCATTAVEEICDKVCKEIEEKINQQGKALTSRFSPGYGDLSISMQKDFISVLEADKKIGLTASDHSILIPRKSVTAVAGITNIFNKIEDNKCLTCGNYSNCAFKRRGSCGR